MDNGRNFDTPGGSGGGDEKTPVELSTEEIKELFSGCFSSTLKYDPKENNPIPTEDIIYSSNQNADCMFNNAKSAIVQSFVKHEEVRMKRQMPLFMIIGVLATIQLIVFNVILTYIAIASFENGQKETLSYMFEMLKYYIGATVVELIAMLAYITSVTFSRDHMKIMKSIFENDKRTK